MDRRRSVPRPSSGAARHLLPRGEGKTERRPAKPAWKPFALSVGRRPKSKGRAALTLRLRSLSELRSARTGLPSTRTVLLSRERLL